TCPTIPDNDGDMLAMIRRRVKKKDPEAICHLGEKYFQGDLALQKDVRKAIDLYTEAAELGSIQALFNLGNSYYFQQDEKRAVQFWSKAAMQGHVLARHNLGLYEDGNGNFDRAVRHYLIAAKIGVKESVETIQLLLKDGDATKEQYAEALKGYRDAVEEMKSHDRDEAKIVLGH
ncbi:hypothetical protein THAOC_11189, partial [Thalassiosira oceanica]